MNLDQQVAELQHLSPGELRSRFAELYGAETKSRNRRWLFRRIAWRLQALAEGDLSERARRRAAELANDADLRVVPPKGVAAPSSGREKRDPRLPVIGTVIRRPYRGQVVEVRVLEDGVEHDGSIYKTLTAAARAITGTHINGFAFFQLGGKR